MRAGPTTTSRSGATNRSGRQRVVRWEDGPNAPSRRQFYSGDSDRAENFGTVPVDLGRTYRMKMQAQTLLDDSTGQGVTRYRWKMWTSGTPEPEAWDWAATQTSAHALRRSGLVLLAYPTSMPPSSDVRVVPLRAARTRPTSERASPTAQFVAKQ